MIRDILAVPHPLLREQSARVEHPQAPEIQALIADLKDTCVAAEGLGLAAPQIGVSQRVAVAHHPAGTFTVLINPEILRASSVTSSLNEGCLSIPGILVSVSRPSTVTVRTLDETGVSRDITASDLLAKIFQHEIDHLNGVLITDYGEGIPKSAEVSKESPVAPLKV